MTEILLIVHNH